MSSHRSARVGDLVRQTLSRLLRESLRDPRIGFVTVTDVEMSADLRHARVYVSILEQDPAETLQALERATPFLRRELARTAGLRFTPSLQILQDASIAQGFQVEDLLRDVRPEDDPEPDEEPQ